MMKGILHGMERLSRGAARGASGAGSCGPRWRDKPIAGGSLKYGGAWRLAAAMLATMLAVGMGCSTQWPASSRMDPRGSEFAAQMRPASGSSDRLLSNAHYFKLMGRPAMALKQLEEAYRLDPNNPKVVDTLARSYEEMGEFDQARKIYQEALDQHGNNPVLNNNLCFSYYQEGRLEQAEACFKEALDRDPHNSAARNNLGLVWCRLGRVDEARRLWQAAEGEAAAEVKLSQTLGALGRDYQPTYAQAPPAVPQIKPVSAPSLTVKTRETAPAAAPAKIRPTQAAAGKKAMAAKPAASRPERKIQLSNQIALARPAPAPVVTKLPEPRAAAAPRRPLSSEELLGTAIEVRNGTPTKNLAHRTRALLSQEGFQVAVIGNHWDFGAEKTKIYYGPGAERVAQALRDQFFPGAELEQSEKLHKHIDVKVLLGHELLLPPQLMARLAEKSN